ncbi:MAG: penicillin acylase family protein [Pseudomonadota bacterium]
MNPLFHARSLLLLVALSALVSCTGEAGDADPSASEDERLQAIAEDITIHRDDFGVPHIYAETDAETVFGLMYAQAEDDFPRIERNYIWATGRLAEVEGAEALYSDLRARLYMTREEAMAAYEAAPDWLRELTDAFADGLNFYLATHPEVEPELIERFEPWMPFYFFEGSIGGDIEQIPLDRIREFYSHAATVAGDPPPQAGPMVAANFGPGRTRMPLAPGEYREPDGSNGFALDGTRTESGDAMLLINPHTSFYFRGEYHAVSEEGLNAYGAITWGQFFVYQGFNEDTGWMHTSTGADFMDEFVQDIVREGDGLYYRYGDDLRELQELEVTLRYRDGDSMSEQTFPMYRTHQGPITHEIDGQWVSTRINWDPVNALRQSYLRMKTADHDGFRDMMDIRTNSSNNTVFADSSGNIAYFHGNFMPRRDLRFDYSQPVDGSDPATDWQGRHEVDEMITLVNPESGWLQNANSTPFTAAGEFSPERMDYPIYMAPDAENFRGLHAVSLLRNAENVTLDSLIELAYDPYLLGFEQLIDGLVDAWTDRSADWPGLLEPVSYFSEWDGTVSTDSIAMTLARFYGNNMLARVDAPDELTAMQRINWMGTDSEPEQRLQVFADTLDELEDRFGDWRTPWGEVNRFQRLSGAIDAGFDDGEPSVPVGMASSRWGALASFVPARDTGTDRLYGAAGNSFVAVVEFGDRVRARTLLAGGQSNDPDSPHFDDQVQMYVEPRFKEAAYYREDVERRAVRTYSPGE